jgi:thioredoxin 1|uniref:Thioredoxin n=1 Tax=Desulfobacca acetoxidans TaxID=60893 RepID=A0A7C3Z1S9_9BACT
MKLLRLHAVWLVFLVMGSLVVWQSWPTLAQGAASGKPALYEFGAKTCLPCIQMKQVMADLKASHGDQVEFRMVYLDENKDLFSQYKIVVIPTQVFFDTSGKEVSRHIGALTKEQVLQKLKELKLLK